MELKLQNGAYLMNAGGGFRTVSGTEELVQRALMRLAARRGGFYPMPDYGSRLHTLCSLKPSERSAAARQFAVEALAEEPRITVGEVEYVPGTEGSAQLNLELICAGERVSAVLHV